MEQFLQTVHCKPSMEVVDDQQSLDVALQPAGMAMWDKEFVGAVSFAQSGIHIKVRSLPPDTLVPMAMQGDLHLPGYSMAGQIREGS